ncbi:udp-glycosyltransferase 88f5 [Quercus suber]|uniref:Udp-glycosyltransferase 88f5 n=1 Tax=Quercus suber TaxID=58331 RepID=A0AAW0J6J7_QUESU
MSTILSFPFPKATTSKHSSWISFALMLFPLQPNSTSPATIFQLPILKFLEYHHFNPLICQKYYLITKCSITLANSTGIIVNTFESLEPRAIQAIADGLCVPDNPTPPVYYVGPLSRGHNEDETVAH